MKDLILRFLGRTSATPGERSASGPRPPRLLRAFSRDKSGAVAIYVGLLLTVLIGVLVLVFDVGRLAVVRSQAQNAADASAIAAAIHLDGTDGARARAEAVARGAANQRSNIETVSGSPNIQIDTVDFYQDVDKTPATSDSDAAFVEVTVRPRPVKHVLEPVLATLTGSVSDGYTNIGAAAMAGNAPVLCDPPALLICNPREVGLDDILLPEAAGRQIMLRRAGNAPVAGNYGLMCPPPYTNCGAPIIEDFLASEGVDACTVTDMSTKTGVTFQKVNRGINHRFEYGSLGYPMAPNIIEFPRDAVFQNGMLGDGDWGPDTYWPDAHNGETLPMSLMNATRFQTYLYELGESYAANNIGQTMFPSPAMAEMPSGFSYVAGGGPIPTDGEPPGANVSPDAMRRVMPAAVVDCVAVGVRGNFDISTRDMVVINVFLTEIVGPPPANNSPIMVEIIGDRRTYSNSDSDIANVQLVE